MSNVKLWNVLKSDSIANCSLLWFRVRIFSARPTLLIVLFSFICFICKYVDFFLRRKQWQQTKVPVFRSQREPIDQLAHRKTEYAERNKMKSTSIENNELNSSCIGRDRTWYSFSMARILSRDCYNCNMNANGKKLIRNTWSALVHRAQCTVMR